MPLPSRPICPAQLGWADRLSCRKAARLTRLLRCPLQTTSTTNGPCDQCASNTGNASAFFTSNSTGCAACATAWNTYVSACAGGSNKACLNYYQISSSQNANSYANLVQLSTGVNGTNTLNGGGDVFDFMSQYYYNALANNLSCSDLFDYMFGYAETLNNDPPNAGPGPNCPVVGSNTTTCSAACNAELTAVFARCKASDLVQYDGNGFPNGTVAPVGTFVTAQQAWTWFLSGAAMGPSNNNLGLVNGGLANASDAAVNLTTCTAINGWPSFATLPDYPASGLSCQAAIAAFTTSANTGNCDACMSNAGIPQACLSNCPACGRDYNNVLTACASTPAASGLNYSLVGNTWAPALATAAGGAGLTVANADCYDLISQQSRAVVGSCSDAFDLLVQYSETNINDPPGASAGPNCAPTAVTCSAACAADLALLGSKCAAGNATVAWTGNGLPAGAASVSTVTAAAAWGYFTSGVYATTAGGNSANGASVALPLTGCSVPAFAANVTTVTGNVSLTGVAAANYSTWNAGNVMEATLAPLLGVPAASIITYPAGYAPSGRRSLLAAASSTTVVYSVAAVSATQATAVRTAQAAVTPTALTTGLASAGASMTGVTVAAVTTSAGVVAPAASAAPRAASAAALLLAAAAAVLL